MNYKEIKQFCECQDYISIQKFLHDYFSIEVESKKLNSKHRKWKIKHNEIRGLSKLIIPISMKFAIRYSELINKGKILIVKDEYNCYQAYYNPKLILGLLNKTKIERELFLLHKKTFTLKNLDSSIAKIKYLTQKVESIEEDERIIVHFGGSDAITYCSSLEQKEQKVLKRTLKH